MKRLVIVIIMLLSCFTASAARLRATSGNLYESRNPMEYQRFVRVGRSLSSQKGDIFDLNYKSMKMTWKDHKGKGVYKIAHIETYDNITVFSTEHHFVKVTKEKQSYTVDIVFRGSKTQWYLVTFNCEEI